MATFRYVMRELFFLLPTLLVFGVARVLITYFGWKMQRGIGSPEERS